jgi:hypothetical protein
MLATIGDPANALTFSDSSQNNQTFWGYATNLAEVPTHSHLLRTGTPGTTANPTGTTGTLVRVRSYRVGATDNSGWQTCYYFDRAPGLVRARITAATGSFPVWSYSVQLVGGYTTANTDPTAWVMTGPTITNVKNRCEWTPGSYPYQHGCGVEVANSLGYVATNIGGGIAGTCMIQHIGIGSTVDLSADVDQNGNTVLSFYAPNSAQVP